MTISEIDGILRMFESKMTLDGRRRVFEDNREMQSEDLTDWSKPEEFTKQNLIEPILSLIGCRIESRERIFEALRNNRREIDYVIVAPSNQKYVVEAKPFNANLYSDELDGAVNQVKDALKLYDVVSLYSYGIATDGNRWVFIDSRRNVVADLTLDRIDDLKAILCGEMKAEQDKDEISRRFYGWYLALLYGGRYKDHSDKTRSIAAKDSLVNNIRNVDPEADREHIAQIIMNRLIFIKFLESKSIIKVDVFKHFMEMDPMLLWDDMRRLFFDVMNTPMSQRKDVGEMYRDIPYLNGSLFVRSDVERKHYGMSVSSEILREVLRFLDSFRFIDGGETSRTLDPEILGYIFEMSMVQRDRKGTGAFYTPRDITAYMCRVAIEGAVIEKVLEVMEKMGAPRYEIEAVKTIDDVYRLGPMVLGKVFSDVLIGLRICDNACGSGAFLLAAADVLFDIYYTINAKANLTNKEITLKRLILGNNIYGVDLNPSAVEIAKLRMWLWMVDSYRPEHIEPLPNIDFNIRTGNSLIGYSSLGHMMNIRVRIDDFNEEEQTVRQMLKERQGLLVKYRSASGKDAIDLMTKIESISNKIYSKLYPSYFHDHAVNVNCKETDFYNLGVFNWGMEFSEVFEHGGFDIIVGNPPYIQLQKMKDTLAYRYYADAGYDTFVPTGDIYALFYERSSQLLRDGGRISYITSNSWIKTRSGQPLRDHFIKVANGMGLYDLTDLKIFRDATVECSIVSYSISHGSEGRETNTIRSCNVDVDFDINNIGAYFDLHGYDITCRMGQGWNIGDDISQRIMDKMSASGMPLGSWDLKINYGIKTGCNDAFIIEKDVRDRLIADDPGSVSIIRPVLRGKDIKRYVSGPAVVWMIFTHNGSKKDDIPPVDVNCYRSVKNHLDKYKKRIEGREDQGDTCYNLRNCAYLDDFEKSKIAWIDLADVGRFSFVPSGTVVLNTTFFFVAEDPRYLLGVLNSTLITWYFHFICATSGAGTHRWIKQYVELIPVPVNPSNKSEIESLVEKVMENPEDSDSIALIDREVFKAYGLTDEEIEYVSKHS